MTEWICVNCAARHDSNDPPCRRCAHEQFAKVDEQDVPEKIESSVDLKWECKNCGERQPKNNTPCSNCGNHTFEAIYLSQDSTSRDETNNTVDEEVPESGKVKKVNSRTVLAYILGVGTALVGILYVINGTLSFGLPLIATGSFVTPYTQKRIKSNYSYVFSRGAIIFSYILGLAVAIGAYNIFNTS